MLETLRKNKPFLLDFADEEEGTTTGGIALSIEAYLLAALNQDRRERPDGQKKFGVCPLSENPNNLLSKKTSRACSGFAELPQQHPLLAWSQQFSGDDTKITAIPSDSSKAKERFSEQRLENQLRKNFGLGRRKSVTLVR